MNRILRQARILSLDVALGAIASAGMVVWWIDQPMPLIWWMILPASVWVIYTWDHLLDAYRLKAKAHTVRHLFHFNHFSTIGTVSIGVALLCLCTGLIWLPASVFKMGMIMILLVFLHFGIIRWVGGKTAWFLHKELGVGTIYTAGVWGGPLILFPQSASIPLCLLLGQFFGLVMINLLTFSMYECDIDEIDEHTSFVRAVGIPGTQKILVGIACMVCIIGVSLLMWRDFSVQSLKIQVIYFLMLVILMLVAFFPAFFGKNSQYRAFADGVFLIPALIWL